MRFLILLAAATLALHSCASNTTGDATSNDSLLSTDLVHNPATAGTATTDPRDLPVLTFSADTTHSFGTIREDEVAETSFKFKNTGKAPLLITGASASCGCTVPDYPRAPLSPGAEGTIKVSFNSKGKPGHQEKTVTVSSNTARGNQFLKITAEVTPTGDHSDDPVVE